jgi:radical SAM protein with 4Fe4S-binding SPASM domain
MMVDKINPPEWSFLSSPTDLTSKAMKNSELISPCLPTHAWITLSNYCNLSCKHCRRHYQEKQKLGRELDIPEVLYTRILDDVVPNLHSLILGGNNLSEITQAARFPKMVEWLSNAQNRPNKLSLQTNGSYINDETLNALVALDTVFNISVEGGTNETTKRIRGLSLKTLTKQIERIINYRNSNQSLARIVLSFTAMKSTVEEIFDLVEYAERVGVDEVNVMYLLPATINWNEESLASHSDYSNHIMEEALTLTKSWRVELIAPPIREVQDSPCEKPWHSISIDGNGDVRFCCLDGSPTIGNLLKDELGDIWNGPTAKKVRSEVNTERASSECSSCVVRNIPFVSLSSLRKKLVSD